MQYVVVSFRKKGKYVQTVRKNGENEWSRKPKEKAKSLINCGRTPEANKRINMPIMHFLKECWAVFTPTGRIQISCVSPWIVRMGT